MIIEALVVFGALALVAGLKIWLIYRRVQTTRQLKEQAPAAPNGNGEAPAQRR